MSSENYYLLQKNNIHQACKQDILDLAEKSSKDFLAALTIDNEMEFEDAFYTLCMMCNIGFSEKKDFTEEEKELIDKIFKEYMEAETEKIYPAFSSAVQPDHFNLLNQLNQLGPTVVFPLMDLILCCGYISSSMKEETDQQLQEIYQNVSLETNNQ